MDVEMAEYLLWAVQNCPCPELINDLISEGGNINYRDRNGNTLLHFVNDSITAKDLISRGLDVNTLNNLGYTSLEIAINKRRNCNVVKTLISAGGSFKNRDLGTFLRLIDNYSTLVEDFISLGFDVNVTNDMGETPLQCLLEKYKCEKYCSVIKLLIKNKADVNLKDKKGDTPVILAIENNVSLDVVNALISAGADIQSRDSKGNTLLHRYPSLASQLMYLGLDVNSTNNDGETPLHYLLKNCFTSEMKEKCLGMVQLLIKNKGNVHATDNQGNTPLDWAIKNDGCANIVGGLISVGGKLGTKNFYTFLKLIQNYPTLVKEYISPGFDVNVVTNNKGQTHLHYLLEGNICEKYCRVIKELLKHKVDVNSKDKKGNTPMSLAINKKVSFDIMKALITAGGDIYCRDSEGNSILHHYPSLVGELNSIGLHVNMTNAMGQTPLHFLLEEYRYGKNRSEEYCRAIKEFLQHKVDVNLKDKKGNTPMSLAIKNNVTIDVVNALISAGADIHSRDSKGNSFLHLYPNSASELISFGFDIDLVNKDGETPLHYLLKNCFSSEMKEKCLGMVHLLIKNKANVHATDNRGCTPLGLAIKHKLSCNIIKALISAGADINYRNSEGNTILHMPKYYSLAKYIISLGFDVNKSNSKKQTPLQTLIDRFVHTNVHYQLFYLLISNGAELSLENFSSEVNLRLIIFEHYYNNKLLNLLHVRILDKGNGILNCFKRCQQEIVRMKCHMVNTDLSLFDFIKLNHVPELICTFDDVNTLTFQEYFDLIQFKKSLYFRNKKILHDTQLVNVCESPDYHKELLVQHESLHRILGCLPNFDLFNFMKSIFDVDSATDS